MNIGFDGKRAVQNFTGLGNYSRYIIRLLSKFYPQNQYKVYSPEAPQPGVIIPAVEYRHPERQYFIPAWRSYGIVKTLVRDKIQLFHGLSNEIPYGLSNAGIRSVVTIHDLIYIRYPQYYSFIDRQIYKFKFRYAALKADKIIAISEQTKDDLVKYFNIQESKIEVIYQDCDPIFHEPADSHIRSKVKAKYKLPDKYLLNVGTIEERKNVMLIVKALARTKDIELVVVGRQTKYTRLVKDFVKQNNLNGRVHFLENVLHQDLPAIYQQSALFIYPSRFEGFGIPIIEALHSAVPVIAATGSCLEEAGGPCSIYVHPDDDSDLATQIESIINNPERQQLMVSSGKRYLEKFNDKRISNQIIQLYQNIIENA